MKSSLTYWNVGENDGNIFLVFSLSNSSMKYVEQTRVETLTLEQILKWNNAYGKYSNCQMQEGLLQHCKLVQVVNTKCKYKCKCCVKLSHTSPTLGAAVEANINTMWRSSSIPSTLNIVMTCPLALDGTSIWLPSFYKNTNSHQTEMKAFQLQREKLVLINSQEEFAWKHEEMEEDKII